MNTDSKHIILNHVPVEVALELISLHEEVNPPSTLPYYGPESYVATVPCPASEDDEPYTIREPRTIPVTEAA